jgi:hypothetical protein
LKKRLHTVGRRSHVVNVESRRPLALVYVNWIVIPVEEATLTEVFGAEYGGYRRRVRRWL